MLPLVLLFPYGRSFIVVQMDCPHLPSPWHSSSHTRLLAGLQNMPPGFFLGILIFYLLFTWTSSSTCHFVHVIPLLHSKPSGPKLLLSGNLSQPQILRKPIHLHSHCWDHHLSPFLFLLDITPILDMLHPVGVA